MWANSLSFARDISRHNPPYFTAVLREKPVEEEIITLLPVSGAFYHSESILTEPDGHPANIGYTSISRMMS